MRVAKTYSWSFSNKFKHTIGKQISSEGVHLPKQKTTKNLHAEYHNNKHSNRHVDTTTNQIMTNVPQSWLHWKQYTCSQLTFYVLVFPIPRFPAGGSSTVAVSDLCFAAAKTFIPCLSRRSVFWSLPFHCSIYRSRFDFHYDCAAFIIVLTFYFI